MCQKPQEDGSLWGGGELNGHPGAATAAIRYSHRLYPGKMSVPGTNDKDGTDVPPFCLSA
ncbi:protein of unknown function [Bradyrhizobium vignae]|uniref:Uncharacterized protein n=1 Tax=Bradyrhizobium vignae TaxID=1549949 RepID=A0A2U3PXB6_9BRAD|nr:protein of unknown function [Bradyrhizobium vignae]